MPTITVHGSAIHYETSGTGRVALCLVHGAGGSTEVWRAQLDGLAGAARVVALDLPGHGQSAGDGIASIDQAADTVRAFVEALGLGRVVIGGHSMGGAISQTFALRAPEHTAGVILVGTGARLRVLPKIIELIDQDYPAAVRLVVDLGVAAVASPRLKQSIYEQTLRTPPRVLDGDFRACDRFDIMPRVGEIRLPTLIVTGIDDQLTPPKYAEFLRSRLPAARLVIVPGAGHYVQMERPDEVTLAFHEFLATLAGPRA